MREKLKGPKNEGDISEGLNDLSNCVVINCEVRKDVEKDGLSEGFDDVENKEKNGSFNSVKSVEKSDDHGSGLAMDVNDLSNDEVLRCVVKMSGNVVKKDGLENKEKDLSFMSVETIEKNDNHGSSGITMDVLDLSGQVVTDLPNDNMKIMGRVIDMGGLNEGIDDVVEKGEKDKRPRSVETVTENNDHGNQGSTIKVMEIENLHALASAKDSKPNLDDNVVDSLSIFLPKAQSVLFEKSGSNMEPEMESDTRTLKDGECSHDASHLPTVEVERSLSSYMDSQKLLELVKISTDSTSSHDNTALHQGPDEHMENTSIAENIIVKIGSSDDCTLQIRELMPIKEGTHNDNNGFDPSSGHILLDACTPTKEGIHNDNNGFTSRSVSPDVNYDRKEGKGILQSTESKEKNLSEASKRKSKRRRHDDMAYEDDIDWDGLIQKQGFSQCRLVEEDDPSYFENIGAAAVSEANRVAALASVEVYASSEAKCSLPLELPKIPSFSEFARRKKYTKVDGFDARKKGSSGTGMSKKDRLSEIDFRESRIMNRSTGLESTRDSLNNLSQRSQLNEFVDKLILSEYSAENEAINRKIFTKAWVESFHNERIKDYYGISKWKSQAAEATGSEINHQNNVGWDEDKSNVNLKQNFDGREYVTNEISVSQVAVSMDLVKDIKKAVVDFVASLLMPLYKENKFDKESYKSMMKKTVNKVMDHKTVAEKAMRVDEFLDSKRKNKIRAFVDKLIEKHIAAKVLECCDDEPIGNLFSIKTNKSPKKVKETVASGESYREVLIVGGLDDTLASMRKNSKGLKNECCFHKGLNDLSNEVIVKCGVKRAGDVVEKGGLSEGFDDDAGNVEKSNDHGSGLAMDVNDLPNDEVLRCEVKMAGNVVGMDGLKDGVDDDDVQNTEKDRSFMSVESVVKSDDHGNSLARDVSSLSGQVANDLLNKMRGLNEGTDDGVGNKETDKGSKSVYLKEHNDNGFRGSIVKVVDVKKAVVDFVASLLMPLYKENKFNKESYKSLMKKTVTKVMDHMTVAEKAMVVDEFLDSKRKNKIRAFVDKWIVKHTGAKP